MASSRVCWSLSKKFPALRGSKEPFSCVSCQRHANSSEIKQLRSDVKWLKDELVNLKSQVAVGNCATESEPESLPVLRKQSSHMPVVPSDSSDRKCNLIIFGIKECESGLRRQERTLKDIDSAYQACGKVDSSVSSNDIIDCFRLGKFRTDTDSARPLLVKFSHRWKVDNILSKRFSIRSPGVFIQPDFPPDIRKIRSNLFKERRNLISQGIGKISIRNDRLFVDNKEYGKATISDFVRSMDQPGSVPGCSSPSKSGDHADPHFR